MGFEKNIRILILIVCSLVFSLGVAFTTIGISGCSTGSSSTTEVTTPTVTSNGTTLSFTAAAADNVFGIENTIVLTFDEAITATAADTSVSLATTSVTLSGLSLTCNETAMTVSVTTTDYKVFTIDPVELITIGHTCVMSLSDIEADSGAELDALTLNFTAACSATDHFNDPTTLDTCWTLLYDTYFGTLDADTTNDGLLSVGNAIIDMEENATIMQTAGTVTGAIDIEVAVVIAVQADIVDDTGECWNDDLNEVTGVCDTVVMDEIDGVPYSATHPYGTSNMLDNFIVGISTTDSVSGAIMAMGKQSDTKYCIATDNVEAFTVSETLCAFTPSADDPLYIRIQKEDGSGTVTFSVKGGSTENYTTVGAVTVAGLETETLFYMGFVDADELDCYGPDCRAAWESDTDPAFAASADFQIDYVRFDLGTVAGQY